jgi:serine/threonine protein kinase
VVHRDLKPDNILLLGYNGDDSNMRDIRVKVIDFGLAKANGNK